MNQFDIQTPRGQLRWLLVEVTKALQISPTQYKLAVERYEAALQIYPELSAAQRALERLRAGG